MFNKCYLLKLGSFEMLSLLFLMCSAQIKLIVSKNLVGVPNPEKSICLSGRKASISADGRFNRN